MLGNKRENVELPSQDTGAYCQARQRLPEKLLQQLFSKVAEGLQAKVTPKHLWCGRHVKVIDGSTVSMPDTEENQKIYPLLRRGKIVGSHDKQVIWHKPKTCPKGLTKEEFATLALTLAVREVHYYIAISGFRTQQVSLITTLLDAIRLFHIGFGETL